MKEIFGKWFLDVGYRLLKQSDEEKKKKETKKNKR